MKKILHIGICAMIIVTLTGCAEANFKPETDAVFVKGNGAVTKAIIEDFDKEFYDSDELKKMIDEEISDYNAKFGDNHITVKKYEVADGRVLFYAKYDESKYYADYNDVTFFNGTIRDALDTDYEISGEFADADGEAVKAADAVANEKNKVVIFEEPMEVYTSGKILYVSEGVELIDKKQAVIEEIPEGQAAVIVYK